MFTKIKKHQRKEYLHKRGKATGGAEKRKHKISQEVEKTYNSRGEG